MNIFLLIISSKESCNRVTIDNDNFSYKYFIADDNIKKTYEEKDDIVYVKVDEKSISELTYLSYKYIYDNYKDINGVFKTIDDVKIDLDSLKNEIEDDDCEKYIGDAYYNKDINCSFCLGVGYYVDKSCLKYIVDGEKTFKENDMDDVAVGIILNNKKIRPYPILINNICTEIPQKITNVVYANNYHSSNRGGDICPRCGNPINRSKSNYCERCGYIY